MIHQLVLEDETPQEASGVVRDLGLKPQHFIDGRLGLGRATELTKNGRPVEGVQKMLGMSNFFKHSSASS